jgi:hypothetical protein
MKEYLKKMFSDSPDVSLTRVLTFLVVMDVMITWTFNCIGNGEIKDIPWNVVTLVAIMITGKAAQAVSERFGRKEGEDK